MQKLVVVSILLGPDEREEAVMETGEEVDTTLGDLIVALTEETGRFVHDEREMYNTETVQYPGESDYRVADTYGRSQEPVVVEKRTEETTTETRRESGGLLSGAVHVIGETLALPFRAVGGLLGVIF